MTNYNFDIQMRRLELSLFLWLGLTITVFGQTSVALQLDSTNVLIGDKITANITIKNPSPNMVLDWGNLFSLSNQEYSNDTIKFEKHADLSLLDSGQWQASDDGRKFTITQSDIANNTAQNTIIFAIYNEGTFSIDPPKITGDSIQNITSPSQTVQVHLPKTIANATDTIQINPIKDIIKTKANFSDYLPYILGFIGALALAFLVWYLVRKENKKDLQIQDIKLDEPIISAYDLAMQSLQVLENKQLWQNGQIKAYQTELTDIIRKYIEGNFGIQAQEMTTTDLLDALDPKVFDTSLKSTLSDILNVADLVKFAKATPDSNVHQTFLNTAFQWVRDTNDRLISPPKEISGR